MPHALPQLLLHPDVDHYCVIGNPVSHSLSPQIHRAFAEQTGEAIDYQAVLVETDAFADSVRALRDQGLRGANITLPFKHEAWALCDRRSARAERAGAVNTLSCSDAGLFDGDNTDGIGLLRDLRDNQGVELADRDILIAGAGGAVAGIIDSLFDARPASITIANRSLDKARQIAARFADRGRIQALAYAELGERAFPLIINGTSLSLQGQLPALPERVLAPGGFVYDMMYQHEPTCFMRWAEQHGAAASADGLGMLVEQAAEAFALWRGVRPDSRPVIAQLRG
ncbi:shikimate dehydrogenase [Methylohalomonas lacus]|uniref:Shikimate dehydrogenase (NADP(+)) n=1 Tax=Methylohalomonas lacus TaxID=398773 RepID=A0AAE3HN45_9GAMM|nr:shikimate dehydrogenase [Methylohalomonas lacus]MCS3904297.1 shikimate dehydrogenase [Methylohalomonas lacus]